MLFSNNNNYHYYGSIAATIRFYSSLCIAKMNHSFHLCRFVLSLQLSIPGLFKSCSTSCSHVLRHACSFRSDTIPISHISRSISLYVPQLFIFLLFNPFYIVARLCKSWLLVLLLHFCIQFHSVFIFFLSTILRPSCNY